MSPHGPGETACIYRLCALFKANPGLRYQSIVIHQNGRVDVAADGNNGVLMEWSRALPDHVSRSGLATTFYGSTETSVLEQDGITVTVKRQLHVGPGGGQANG